MPTPQKSQERRQGIRASLLVAHRHRVGGAVSQRLSELVYMKGRPFALLEWVDLGNVRTPLYICELNPAKLRADTGNRHLFHYDDLTVDPRYALPD